jgi:hypothetical protein
VIEHAPEHDIICGSEPVGGGGECGEGETAAERQPPQALGCEPPTWRTKCRSGFTTLPLAMLLEQPDVVH